MKRIRCRRRLVKIRRLLFGARCAREVCAFCGHRAPLWYQWQKAKQFEAEMRLLDIRRRWERHVNVATAPDLPVGVGFVVGSDPSAIERAIIRRVNAPR